jgi:competence protein ComEC
VLSAGLLDGLVSVPIGLRLSGWVWLVIALILFGAALRRKVWSVVPLLLCGLIIGAWRGSDVSTQLSSYGQFFGQKVMLSGTIKDDPADNDRGQSEFRLQNVVINKIPLNGEVKASIAGKSSLKRSDKVILSGKLRTGFSSYQADMSFASLQSTQHGTDPIGWLRDTFAKGVKSAINDPAASLGLGFVVGQRSQLPKSLDENLKKVGLTHIVVASGYNLTILVRLSRRFFAKTSKYLATVSSVALMGGFLLVTGFSPSMTRAGLVTGLVLWAWYYGRNIHPFVLVLFAAALTAMIDPVYIWANVGWYLSFLSFAGVLLLAPLIQRQLFGKKEISVLPQVTIETISAQIATLPIGLLVFGKLSILSLPANILVVPFIPLAMLFTFAAGTTGMISQAAATWVGLPATYVIDYMLAVINWLASISWAQVDAKLEIPALAVLVVAIIGIGIFFWRRLRYNYLETTVID